MAFTASALTVFEQKMWEVKGLLVGLIALSIQMGEEKLTVVYTTAKWEDQVWFVSIFFQHLTTQSVKAGLFDKQGKANSRQLSAVLSLSPTHIIKLVVT